MSATPNLDRILKRYNELTYESPGRDMLVERVLYHMLEEFKYQLPPLETAEDFCNFHKAFSTLSPLPSPRLNTSMGHLLSYCNRFWSVGREVFYGET